MSRSQNRSRIYQKSKCSIAKIFKGGLYNSWYAQGYYSIDISKPLSTDDPNQLEGGTYTNKVCRHTIIIVLSNYLFDVHCTYKGGKVDFGINDSQIHCRGSWEAEIVIRN